MGQLFKDKICELKQKSSSQHTFLTKKIKEFCASVRASYAVSRVQAEEMKSSQTEPMKVCMLAVPELVFPETRKQIGDTGLSLHCLQQN
jgi:hypothetical protein